MRQVLIQKMLARGAFHLPVVQRPAPAQPCETVVENDVPSRKLRLVLDRSRELMATTEHRIAALSLYNQSIRSVSLDPNIRLAQTGMTHVCKKTPIIDQQQTGTCWMQAGLSFLSVLAANKGLTLGFSSAYLAFFDKLDKAHTFLRFLKTDHDDRTLWHYLQDGPIQDGGTWPMFMRLIQTYGVVPLTSMPETYQSTHSRHLNKYLNRYLRSVSRDVIDGQIGEDDVMRRVHDALLRAYSIPPDTVALNEAAHGIDRKIAPSNMLALLHDDWKFVVLTHAPDREDGWYIGPYGNDPDNLWQDRFCCVDMHVLVQSCIDQLAEGVPVWMSADINHDFSSKSEMAAHNLHDTDTILGLTTRDSQNKIDRIRNRNTAPVHAMLFVGVTLDDATKEPARWLIQNSWGKGEKKSTGMVAASHEWFREHVFQVAIRSRFARQLPAESGHRKLRPWDIFATVAK